MPRKNQHFDRRDLLRTWWRREEQTPVGPTQAELIDPKRRKLVAVRSIWEDAARHRRLAFQQKLPRGTNAFVNAFGWASTCLRQAIANRCTSNARGFLAWSRRVERILREGYTPYNCCKVCGTAIDGCELCSICCVGNDPFAVQADHGRP